MDLSPHLIYPHSISYRRQSATLIYAETENRFGSVQVSASIRSRIISIAKRGANRSGYSHADRSGRDIHLREVARVTEAAEDKQSAAWRCILIDAPAAAGSVGGEGGEEEEDDETENRDGGRERGVKV
jgi:hypothetical protein